MTKKSDLFYLRENEKRDSELKLTKQFIQNNTASSLMNNVKWKNLFELLEASKSSIEIKLLLSHKTLKSYSILELENSSLLIDSYAKFIDFFEIEEISFLASENLINFLKKSNITSIESNDVISILGYQMK